MVDGGFIQAREAERSQTMKAVSVLWNLSLPECVRKTLNKLVAQT